MARDPNPISNRQTPNLYMNKFLDDFNNLPNREVNIHSQNQISLIQVQVCNINKTSYLFHNQISCHLSEKA